MLALPASAQVRNINLTGTPIKAIDEPFTLISGVRELPGNKVIVADSREKRVGMVNFTTGAFTSIGRVGNGPGEFQVPMALFAGPGTDTWVADPQAGKVHVVTADGKLQNAILPPEGEGGTPLFIPRAVDAAGRFYMQAVPRLGGGAAPVVDSFMIVRWDRATKKTDTLGKVPSGMSVSTSGSSGGNMRMMIRSKPLAATPVWSALPDGHVAVVQPSPYRVDLISANRSVSRGPAQAYTPITVTAAERAAYRARRQSNEGPPITRTIGGGGGGGNVSTSSSAAPSAVEIPDDEFPEVMPPFSGQGSVLVSLEGEIWVLRTRRAADKVPTYDIFNSAGQLTGKATLKPNSVVVGFGAGVVYVARQDPEDDLRYLEKYAR